MSRSRNADTRGKQSEPVTGKKPFRIELSFWQLVAVSLSFIGVLGWMFVFGILVGRGLPLVDSTDVSLRAQLIRFMGLGRESPRPPADAAETWESPQKILESLDYYQSLAKKPDTQKAHEAFPGLTPGANSDSSNKRPDSTATTSSTQSADDTQTTSDAEKNGQPSASERDLAESSSERYTLLAASLRDLANAQRFIEELRSRGYAPRLETIEMAESGRWNRVLVGSFESREEALRFAAEFNRKEGRQGLVIREGR